MTHHGPGTDSPRPSRDPHFGEDSNRGWFPNDAEAHRRDAPQHCPACGTHLSVTDGGQGLAVEYWTAADRVFVTYCSQCHWTGDITPTTRVVGHEPDR
jgi:hypothetical protein